MKFRLKLMKLSKKHINNFYFKEAKYVISENIYYRDEYA